MPTMGVRLCVKFVRQKIDTREAMDYTDYCNTYLTGKFKECDSCNGTGSLPVDFGGVDRDIECPDCSGSGEVEMTKYDVNAARFWDRVDNYTKS